MSTTSITHRPTSFVVAAAAALAIGAGAVVLSVADDSGSPSAPADRPGQSSIQQPNPHHDFHYTQSGGHVMTGL